MDIKHNAHGGAAAESTRQGGPPGGPGTQVPPYKSGQAVKLLFEIKGDGLIVTIATGTDAQLGSMYKQNTEYWYAKPTSILSAQDLTMTFTSQAYTGSDIGAIVQGYTPAFQQPEGVAKSAWTTGALSTQLNSATRLFRAPDPDNASVFIGILIVQNANNNLVSVAWYKTCQPAGGWVWQSQNSPIGGLAWGLVTDANGQPSVDPNDIQPNQSWYYFVQG